MNGSTQIGAIEAFQALWPIILSLGGGYGALLFYIRKLMDDRLADKDAQITRVIGEKDTEIARIIKERDELVTQIRAERDEFKGMAYRAISSADTASKLVESTMHR